jgi:hypothetical protein
MKNRDYTRLTVGYTKKHPNGYPNPDVIKLDCV